VLIGNPRWPPMQDKVLKIFLNYFILKQLKSIVAATGCNFSKGYGEMKKFD